MSTVRERFQRSALRQRDSDAERDDRLAQAVLGLLLYVAAVLVLGGVGVVTILRITGHS